MLLDYILENKNEILDIFDKYGSSNVVIIGSVSRRDEIDGSDIDFVADLKKNENIPEELDVQAYTDLVKELSRYFNRKVELASYEQIRKGFPVALSYGIYLERSSV
ncbi:nucleotidyltransferase domain-containing protein [Neobacillus drentensis]|uniref:nucleotidyltransferase family protein n=1 Tax=Neobacillus drentensis TaxID=220684 RepID=UPI002FFF50A4